MFSNTQVGVFTVTVRVDMSGNEEEPWWLTSVYGPKSNEEKTLFLEELEAIRDACAGPWVVAGDFNLILEETDKNNARINRRNMLGFRRVVDRLELRDIHLLGRLFTWNNECHNSTLVKLDRVLISVDWEDRFPNCFLQALSSEGSDHCPLLLQSNAAIFSKSRFHFESFWPKLEGYMEAVSQGWSCTDDTSDPFCRLDSMFRNTARHLQSWADKKIGNVRLQLILAKELILRYDRAQETRALSDEEQEFRKQLKVLCLSLASLERTIARHRSRMLPLREGDASTKFFHLHATYRRRKNHIISLQLGDNTAYDQQDKAEMLHSYFTDILGTEFARPHTLDLRALGIEQRNLDVLDLPFTEDELWSVIKELKPDKAPSPDGFTIAFYQTAWPIIKSDIMVAFTAFYAVRRR